MIRSVAWFLRDARIITAFVLAVLLLWNKAEATTCPSTTVTWCTIPGACGYTTFPAAYSDTASYWLHPSGTYDFRAIQWQLDTPTGTYMYYVYYNTHGTSTYAGVFSKIKPDGTGAAAMAASATDPGFITGYDICTTGPAPPTDAECLARGEHFTPFQFHSGSIICMAGCEYLAANAGDGGEVLLGPTGENSGCSYDFDGCPTGYTDASEIVGGGSTNSLSTECIPDNGDIDGDGTENSEDESPYEEGTEAPADSDGDGETDRQDFAPTDETNGEDDGAGDETDNVSSGGGNCSTPPTSSGDGIAAQIAFQTWSTRCAVERQTATLKSGTVTVGVTGVGTGGGEEADTSFADVVAGADEGDGDLTASDAFGEPGGGTGAGGFDDEGFLTEARTCPDLPTIPLPDGEELDLNEKFENFCEFMRIGGLFVYLFAALASIKIYSKVFS